MNKLISNEDDVAITSIEELLEVFYTGCKEPQHHKIGFEYEKLPLQKNNFKAASYQSHIRPFLEDFKNRFHWEGVYEHENLIGLYHQDGSTISLEPGCQTELSTKTIKTLGELETVLKNYNQQTAQVGEDHGIYWLGSGLQPLSTYDDITLIPKGRYDVMNHYLPQRGSMAKVMMRETAGTQVTIDYTSEEDAMLKLKVSLALSPFATAIFANSPLRAGQINGYKSYRAYSWCHTDEERCGLISPHIFEDRFQFMDYVNYLLDMPMMFLYKGGKYLQVQDNVTFRTYLQNGYQGYKATKADWNLYLTTPFPDVRLKHFIEIRSTDSHNTDLALAVASFWKGIMYSENALAEAWDLVKNISWEERQQLRVISAKEGLEGRCGTTYIQDIAQKLLSLAITGLQHQQESTHYLDPIVELVAKGQSPADRLLTLWNKDWHHDLTQWVKSCRIQ